MMSYSEMSHIFSPHEFSLPKYIQTVPKACRCVEETSQWFVLIMLTVLLKMKD